MVQYGNGVGGKPPGLNDGLQSLGKCLLQGGKPILFMPIDDQNEAKVRCIQGQRPEGRGKMCVWVSLQAGCDA
mgnify:CR=1 FL=1